MTQQQNPNPNDDESLRVEVQTPGFKFSMDNEDTWATVIKFVVAILAVYGGIHFINQL